MKTAELRVDVKVERVNASKRKDGSPVVYGNFVYEGGIISCTISDKLKPQPVEGLMITGVFRSDVTLGVNFGRPETHAVPRELIAFTERK